MTQWPPLKAWFMVFRIQAVVVWAVVTVCVSTALAAFDGASIRWVDMILVTAIAAITQGFPAHIVNEIYDWKSGTDRVRGKPSGGGKVITSGLTDVRGLWLMFIVTTVIDFLLSVWLFERTRSWMLMLLFSTGFLVCIFYTMPPIRLAYRPFAGEWLGGFSGVVMNMLGSYYIQTGRFSVSIVYFSLVLGMVFISIMLLFHYLDHENDADADPKKNTTIVFLGLENAHRYNLLICGLAIVGSILLTRFVHYAFVLLLLLTTIHFVFLARCSPHDAPSILKCGKAVTAAMVSFGLCFSCLANFWFLLLVPVVMASRVLHHRYGKRPILAG